MELGSAATTGTITGIGSQFWLPGAVSIRCEMVDVGPTRSAASPRSSWPVPVVRVPAPRPHREPDHHGTGTLSASGGGRIEMGSAGTAIANEIVVDADPQQTTTSSVLSAATLAVASGGLFDRYGDADGTMANAGTVEATGNALTSPDRSTRQYRLFTINTASLLEIAADTSAGNTMSFIGSSGE